MLAFIKDNYERLVMFTLLVGFGVLYFTGSLSFFEGMLLMGVWSVVVRLDNLFDLLVNVLSATEPVTEDDVKWAKATTEEETSDASCC